MQLSTLTSISAVRPVPADPREEGVPRHSASDLGCKRGTSCEYIVTLNPSLVPRLAVASCFPTRADRFCYNMQVAKELAAAGIPIILSSDGSARSSYRRADAVVGPPLSRSIGSYLVEAGVQFGLAVFFSGTLSITRTKHSLLTN